MVNLLRVIDEVSQRPKVLNTDSVGFPDVINRAIILSPCGCREEGVVNAD